MPVAPLLAAALFVPPEPLCPVPRPETVLDGANSWAFMPKPDPFTADALLDLRGLNEDRAGETGFVRLSEGGDGFVRGDGSPVRFWVVGTDAHKFSPADMDRHARWLAKRGVNMVRLHVTVCVPKAGADITDVDDDLIAGCHRFIKSCRDSGIYVLISPYYGHFAAPESWGLAGGTPRMEGLIYLDPKVRAAYRTWTREFYTRPNPHTGVPIAEDPTVAVLQVLNEDSLFFWTAQRLPDHHRKLLAGHFSDWLAGRYGSVREAWDAWGNGFKGRDPLDDVEAGRVAVLRPYDLTQAADDRPAYRARLKDTAEFLATFQRDFYAGMGAYLRGDLGCRQVLNATNWRTADDDRLKALERYSYHALEVDAENEYVGSDYQHEGPNASYRIDPGHYLVNESVLGKPLEMCTNFRQTPGHPFFVTETAWKNPNRYQSEGPFLVAAYQSLTGIDGVAWFAFQTPGYESDPRKPFWRVGDEQSVHKWSHGYPTQSAGFPANALLYRRGDLREAAPVVREVRSLGEVFDRRVPAVPDGETYGDARRPEELEPGYDPPPGTVNRAAFLVGPVVTETVPGPVPDADPLTVDLSEYFDPAAGTITSATGELRWDYKRQVCTMDAPRAQGVAGFLKSAGGRFELSDVTVESDNDYLTLNVVSLDDEPLATSGRVLVQAVTVNRLTGYRTEKATYEVGKGDSAYAVAGERIARLGQPPLRVADVRASVTIDNPELSTATVLDVNGYARGTVPVTAGRIALPADAFYVVLSGG